MKKSKRFLSLLLALVMSLALAAPAFAADGPDDPDAGIMPLAQVYPQEPVSTSSGNSVGPFTTSPGAGKYLRVWFRNYTGAEVTVILMNGTNSVKLDEVTVSSGSGDHDRIIYEIPTPDTACTFWIRFESRNGEWIRGDIAAAQYVNKPS